MDIELGNIVHVITDSGERIRLDRIDDVYVSGGKVNAMVGGIRVDATNVIGDSAAQATMDVIIDAQRKYVGVLQLITRYDVVDGKRIYTGGHTLMTADVNDPNWIIYKYTYSGDDLIKEQGPLIGVWRNRENLEWD
jgi:hypothetical protein